MSQCCLCHPGSCLRELRAEEGWSLRGGGVTFSHRAGFWVPGYLLLGCPEVPDLFLFHLTLVATAQTFVLQQL